MFILVYIYCVLLNGNEYYMQNVENKNMFDKYVVFCLHVPEYK